MGQDTLEHRHGTRQIGQDTVDKKHRTRDMGQRINETFLGIINI